jgi:hypothetical protein
VDSHAEEFIKRQEANGVRIEGDYLIHPDGRDERITDPAYWYRRNEIQHKLKGERPVYGGFGEVYWVKE